MFVTFVEHCYFGFMLPLDMIKGHFQFVVFKFVSLHIELERSNDDTQDQTQTIRTFTVELLVLIPIVLG
jgi:hypothetical protein